MVRHDIREAWRLLRRAPCLNALIVAVLAGGIAATVTMFSVVRAVVLLPLAFDQAERLTAIETRMNGPDISGGFSSYPDFLDWQREGRSFERMGAYAAGGVTLTGTGDPAILQIAFVSDDLLPLLGARPIAGSLFSPGADPHALPLVVISERFWRAKLAAEPGVIGRSVTLDGKPYTIVGILPRSFQFPIQPDPIDGWIPLGSHPSTAQYEQKRGAGFLHVVGRLAPGVTLDAARSDLAGIAARLTKRYPQSNVNRTVTVARLRDDLVREYRVQLLLLLAASAAVLLTACANVAHLLITRALARRREFAIRAALGAARGRLARQLLTESLLLAGCGGTLGTALAWRALAILPAHLPTYIPRLAGAQLDVTTLLVAIGATGATGLLFGVVPALRCSSMEAASALRDARGSSGNGAGLLRAVIVAEVAVSLVLLTTAGLLTRSLLALEHVDPGFKPDRLAVAELSLPDSRYPDAVSQAAFVQRLGEHLAAAAGVRDSAAGTTLPLSGSDLGAAFSIDGHPAPGPSGYYVAPYYSVTPGYFATLGIPLVRGRFFGDADTAHAPPVAIISASLAAKYFPGDDPIGKQLRTGFGQPGVPREIVGIVGDVKQRELGQPMQPQFYTPFAQVPWPFAAVVVRGAGAPAVAEEALRQAIAATDPTLPPGDIATMDDYVARSTATPSVTATVIGAFAMLAALLAAVGLYGVMAHAVARRQRELGIRLALGAAPRDLGVLVLREALILALAGVGIGLAGAVAASRAIRALLFGVTASDPRTFIAVAVGVCLIMVGAAAPSIVRSVRSDPLEAMRTE